MNGWGRTIKNVIVRETVDGPRDNGSMEEFARINDGALKGAVNEERRNLADKRRVKGVFHGPVAPGDHNSIVGGVLLA